MSRGLLQLTSEWAPGAGEHQSPSHTARTSEASRSSKGSKQLGGDMNGGGEADEGTITVKKKRAPKFLVKQFGMITKGSTGASPRRNLKLLGKDYVVPVPAGSSAAPPSSRTLPGSTSETTTSVDPDLNAPISEPSKKRTSHVAKPPIEFVTAPVDYSLEKVSEEPPFDFVTERRGGSLSRSRSLLVLRSPGGSGSESRQSYTPRSERSVLSVPETVISSAAHHEYSVKSRSRATSVSSLVEWSGGSLDRHGELSIAALSIEGEGRNISRRTEMTSAQSPASRSEAAHAPGYSPDDTDSGVEMYHETTSASPGSYSRRSSCTATEEWISELEDSDGVSHQYRRSKHRDRNDLRYSSRSQPGSGRYAQFQASKQTFHDSSPKTSHYYHHRTGSRRDHKRRDDSSEPKVTKVLLGKYGHHRSSKSKGHDHRKVQAPDDDMVALDSMTPQEAIAVFHEEVARMMLEEGEECVEANDVEEFLDGYLRLRSPFYSSMVDEFFRAVCVDCYKRPVEVNPNDVYRSGSFSTSSKSLRSTIMPDRGL